MGDGPGGDRRAPLTLPRGEHGAQPLEFGGDGARPLPALGTWRQAGFFVREFAVPPDLLPADLQAADSEDEIFLEVPGYWLGQTGGSWGTGGCGVGTMKG